MRRVLIPAFLLVVVGVAVGQLTAPASAAPAVLNVEVVNPSTSPVPVTGSVDANVSGSVNATVTGTVDVSGTVGISTEANTVQIDGPVTALPGLPSMPFFDAKVLSYASDSAVSEIPDDRSVGLSSVTITNKTDVGQIVNVAQKFGAAAGCGSLTSGTYPDMTYLVDKGETLHVPFPVPVVFNPIQTTVCIKLDLQTLGTYTNTVEVVLNGFLAP
jgi:hypothetical protein